MKSSSLCDTPPCPPQATGELQLNEVLRDFKREAAWDVCETGRYRCRYVTWGDGPPLVFIHGLADDADSFVLPMSRLRHEFRCIAYDLPSQHIDGANLAKYKHELLVSDLLAVLDQLNLERVYLFGSSFGSTIALRALHDFPKRFPRAILQGGFARRNLAPPEKFLAYIGRFLPWTMRWFPFRKTTLEQQYRPTFGQCEAPVWEYFVQQSGKQTMRELAYRGFMLCNLDLRPILPEIHQPVLLICGDRDPLVSRKCEDYLLNGLPNATQAVIQGCGHHPYFTHPDTLAELTRRFLTPLPCYHQ